MDIKSPVNEHGYLDADVWNFGVDGDSSEQYIRATTHARLREAAEELLNVMETQENRDDESFHLSITAFRPMWDDAKAKARAALEGSK